jgi:deoxyribose-phosphate aldolase
MEDSKILALVDHTLLAPAATWNDIAGTCSEAIENKCASACIPPSFIRLAKEKYGSALTLCTVIGFPLGYSSAEAKTEEIRKALHEGADEFDTVINIGDAKSGNFAEITKELSILKRAAGDNILKVIIECCYLNEAEKIALCRCVTESGADFIKTSTGFGTGGATLEDIRLFKAHIGSNVKMKAAGGMRSKDDFIAFINEGCLRLGTSAAVKVLQSGGNSDGAY